MNERTCPVCGFDELEFPPRDYSICACCGTEFGYDDRVLTHEQLRRQWIQRGFHWFDLDQQKPFRWNPITQLLRAGHKSELIESLSPKDSASTAPPVTVVHTVQTRVPAQSHVLYIDERAVA
jgi:hypothetical protein